MSINSKTTKILILLYLFLVPKQSTQVPLPNKLKNVFPEYYCDTDGTAGTVTGSGLIFTDMHAFQLQVLVFIPFQSLVTTKITMLSLCLSNFCTTRILIMR